MQFKALRLAGFKSFVDATEVPIEPGITGVVGPNGCGKSNLVEALRWVMGEASARRMRGAEMDDVIFGGTGGRPARNLAEVTLVLDNSARTATAAFNTADELEVSRRIERDAGSDYRVNGRIVRARDVQLLFQDSNSGAASPALVSQGRIGSLISARPSERRLLLEEAAGIQGLHSRRHEAELRLRAAENNLVRLDDVIQAMESQLAALKKQVRQTVRYRNLSERIRSAEATVLLIRWAEAGGRLLAANDAFARSEGQVRECDKALFLAGRVQAEAAADLPELRTGAAAAAAAVQRLVLAQGELEEEARRVAGAQEALARRREQLAADRARETALDEDAQAALQRLEAEKAELVQATGGEEAARTAAEAERDRVQGDVDRLDGDVTRLTETLAREQARRADLSGRAERLTRRRQDLDRRRDGLRQQATTLRAALDEAPDLAALEGRIADLAATLETRQAEAEALDMAQADRGSALSLAVDVQRQAEAVVSRLNAEADGLRALLAADDGGATGAMPVLAALRVDPGLEAALGAALGDTARASTDPQAPLCWTALGSLPAAIEPLPEGATPIRRHVAAPPMLTRRLAGLGLVEDTAAGDSLAPDLAPGQELVARDGTLWRWDGLRIAPGAPSATAQRLAQGNRLTALDAEVALARDALAEATTARDAARTQQEDARQAAGVAQQAVRTVRADLDRLQADSARLARADAERRTRMAALEEQAERLDTDIAEADRERSTVAAELDGLGDLQALQAEAAAHRAALAERRSELRARQDAVDALMREAGQRRRRLAAIAEEAGGWTDRAARAADRIAELDRRSAEAEAERRTLAAQPAEIETKRARLRDQIVAAEHAQKQAADRVAEAETRQIEADRAVTTAQAALGQAREARVRAEAEIAAARTAVDGLRERASERLGSQPDGLAAIAGIDPAADPPDLAAAEARLDRLTRERDAMGPVNLRAETEAEELDAQIAGLLRERSDLTTAIQRLRQAISSLNREARERLLGSFDTVNGHFGTLFTRLFGGGDAHLRLTDTEDPLDAGLEIFASPPGKRLQTLSLLSGGEQALTAIALLFAVFLTNPAPICVLDEVDAPLDDANVDRFCGLLDDLAGSQQTRFLVVTHHRMTMARAHRLFGVTMPEQGVSQLVAVDLERARRFGTAG